MLGLENFAILNSRDAIRDVNILNGYLKALSLGEETNLLGSCQLLAGEVVVSLD